MTHRRRNTDDEINIVASASVAACSPTLSTRQIPSAPGGYFSASCELLRTSRELSQFCPNFIKLLQLPACSCEMPQAVCYMTFRATTSLNAPGDLRAQLHKGRTHAEALPESGPQCEKLQCGARRSSIRLTRHALASSSLQIRTSPPAPD